MRPLSKARGEGEGRLTGPLIFLALVGFIASLTSAPDWIFVVLLVAIVPITAWLLWAIILNRCGERSHPQHSLFLVVLLGWIAGRLSAPAWVNVVLGVLFVPLLAWTIWYVLREWRNEGDDL